MYASKGHFYEKGGGSFLAVCYCLSNIPKTVLLTTENREHWVLSCWGGKGHSSDLWKPSEDAGPPLVADIFSSISPLITSFVMEWRIATPSPINSLQKGARRIKFLCLLSCDRLRSHNPNDTEPLISTGLADCRNRTMYFGCKSQHSRELQEG